MEYASLESLCRLSLTKAQKENIRLQFDCGNLKFFLRVGPLLLEECLSCGLSLVLLGVASLDFI